MNESVVTLVRSDNYIIVLHDGKVADGWYVEQWRGGLGFDEQQALDKLLGYEPED